VGLQLAVMANVLSTNPVRDVQQIKSKRPPKGAPALTADGLRSLLAKLRASEYCREHDLVDPFALLIATGLRCGELLALRWSDFDETSGTLAGCRSCQVTGRACCIAASGRFWRSVDSREWPVLLGVPKAPTLMYATSP
jgi:integrase